MSRHVLIVGAGQHGQRIADTLSAAGHRIRGFAVTTLTQSGNGTLDQPWTLDEALARDPSLDAIVAVGESRPRAAIVERLLSAGVRMPSLVHPRAIVSPATAIGDASVVLAGAIVDTGASIGRGVIVDVGVIVGHHAIVGDWVHLRPGTIVGPRAVVRADATTDCGAIVVGMGDR